MQNIWRRGNCDSTVALLVSRVRYSGVGHVMPTRDRT